MRSSKNRSRSKSNRSSSGSRSVGNIINRVFDSSGPESKVRGTPQQIIDKYTQLTRDAQLSNDRVAAENFQQHAEHYLRMLGEAQREMDARRDQQIQSEGGQQGQPGQQGQHQGERSYSDGGQQNNGQQGYGQQDRSDANQQDRSQQDRNQQDRNQQDRNQQDRSQQGGSQQGGSQQDRNQQDRPQQQGGDQQDRGQQKRPARKPRQDRPAPSVGDAQTAGPSASTNEFDAVIEPVAEGDSTLVETPEAAPKRARRPRKPRVQTDDAPSTETAGGSDAPPQEAAE